MMKAERLYLGLVDEQPKQVMLRSSLAQSLSRQFEYNLALGRSSVALAVTKRLAEHGEVLKKLQPGNARLQRVSRDAAIGRLLAIASSIDYNTAAAAAKGELQGGGVIAGPRRLELAMVLALASGSAAKDTTLSADQRKKASARLAEESVELLKSIRRAFSIPQVRGLLDTWRLAPLRRHQSFQRFRRDLERNRA